MRCPAQAEDTSPLLSRVPDTLSDALPVMLCHLLTNPQKADFTMRATFSFSPLFPCTQALHAAQERGVALHKRKLSELQQDLLARVSTKEQELASKRSRTDTHFRQMTMLLKAAQ